MAMFEAIEESESTTLVCGKETHSTTIVNEHIDTIVLSKQGITCLDDNDDDEFWGPHEIYWHITAVDNREDIVDIRTYPSGLMDTRVTDDRELHFYLLPQEDDDILNQELPSLHSIQATVHIHIPIGRLNQVIIPPTANQDSCQITIDPALYFVHTADDFENNSVPLYPRPDYFQIQNHGSFTKVQVDAPSSTVKYVATGNSTVADIRCTGGSMFRLEGEGSHQQLVIDSSTTLWGKLDISVGGVGAQVMIKGLWRNLELWGSHTRIWYQQTDTTVIDVSGGVNDNVVKAIDNEQAFDFVPLPCLIETSFQWQACPKQVGSVDEVEHIPGPLAPLFPVFLFLLFFGYIGFVLFRVCPCCCANLKPPEEEGQEDDTNNNRENGGEIELPPTVP